MHKEYVSLRNKRDRGVKTIFEAGKSTDDKKKNILEEKQTQFNKGFSNFIDSITEIFDKKVEERVSENNEWLSAMEDAERHYLQMLHLGATPQISRSVLPQSTKSGVTMTANLREWRNFLILRVDTPAHPQMRELMLPLLIELKMLIPAIFDDIGWEE
jgi:thymidylate synthase (FAD)